jgi:hypothetical protein
MRPNRQMNSHATGKNKTNAASVDRTQYLQNAIACETRSGLQSGALPGELKRLFRGVDRDYTVYIALCFPGRAWTVRGGTMATPTTRRTGRLPKQHNSGPASFSLRRLL